MTYNLLYPGVDQHWFSFGIGHRGERYDLDLMLAYALGPTRDVGADNAYNFGKYKSNTFVPALILKYKL